MKGLIMPVDVKVKEDGDGFNVSIFGVDFSGKFIDMAQGDSKDYVDVYLGDLPSELASIVVWAYNLGYESGLKE